MKNKSEKVDWTKDVGSIVLSLVIALLLAQTGALKDFLFASGQSVILGSFFAGVFFTSLFTAAPATVVLAEIATVEPVWEVALIGGLGALVGDYFIFQFIKDKITPHLIDFLQNKKRRLQLIFRIGIWRWIIFVFGALVIASPLPDELGMAMMGLSKMKLSYLLPLSFILNALGILTVGLIARSI